ncbi:MAG TPA: diaminopimelate epimerase [Polyangiaceae bacterium]|nr:diaminopimelate epimerase [Polyangiaceae bacterium]
MRLAFEKYEGLGNDFVLVDVRGGGPAPGPAEARQLCDRRRGVGADGVLLVGPGRSAGASASMIVYNADGSRPEMCGNGLRCVAHYVAGSAPASLVVDTDAGARGCEIEGGEVRVEMGWGRLKPSAVELEAAGQKVRLREVDVGNPHAVVFGPYDRSLFERLGPALATHPHFAAGANVEFVREGAGGELEVLVWERGVGPTEACGTGACAVAVAACAEGLRRRGEALRVRLPGGALEVRVGANARLSMRGPARRAFRGEVEV